VFVAHSVKLGVQLPHGENKTSKGVLLFDTKGSYEGSGESRRLLYPV